MKGFIITLTAGLLLVCGCGSSAGLYSWEKDEIRPIADAVICYGGHSARKPYLWTPERFHETVAYTDENGQEHWFFDNMIMMELWDDDYAVTYSIANDGRYSSRKEHWLRQIDYWFSFEEGALAEADRLLVLPGERLCRS